ncbi:hypothetical protein [Streptomyces sp. NPDC001530]
MLRIGFRWDGEDEPQRPVFAVGPYPIDLIVAATVARHGTPRGF